MSHAFLEQWASWEPVAAPFVLPADEEILRSAKAGLTACFSSPEEYIADEKFNSANDTALHLGLHPMPMLGDLERAKVIFLLLNPGLRPGDYFAEQPRGQYWQALRRSTQQSLRDETYPFVFLNPAFSWHSGFIWWSRKLAVLIERQIALTKTRSPIEAYSTLAKCVANIELFPYHSRKFKIPRRLRNDLPSAKLARQYVHEVLVPRANTGDLLLVVMRCAKDWGLECGNGVCAFSSSEARGAHLGAKSNVGQKVLAHLKLI